MNSYLAWLLFVLVAVLLGAVGYSKHAGTQRPLR